MIDTMILEEAIKKAKEELALKLESGTSGTGSALAHLKSSLEAKLSPWTGTRAAKLDRLDVAVSSRADGSYYTPARASKLDKLDATVSSRLSKTDFDTGSAALKSDISGKIDTQGAALSTAVNDIKNNVLDVKNNLFLTPGTRLSSYALRFSSDDSKNFFTPGSTPPGTTIYSVNGKGKLMHFLASMVPSGGREEGAIFRIEKDGEVFARVKIDSKGYNSYTNVVITSIESLLISDLLKKEIFYAQHVPLDMKGGALATSNPAIFYTANTSGIVLNSHFGGSDLEFNSSLKIIFESLIPQGASGYFDHGAIYISSLIKG